MVAASHEGSFLLGCSFVDFVGYMGSRQRDVFPLPYLHEVPLKNSRLSRVTQRRIHSKAAVSKLANKAIQSLNSLHFGRNYPGSSSVVEDLSLLPLVQQDSIKHILSMVKQLGPPPSDACSQGAMNALQAAGSSYSEPHPDVGTVVNMQLDSLSLPSGNVAGVTLADNLTGEVRNMVEDFENHLLQDASLWTDLEDEAAKIRTYNDPLLSSKSGYMSFLKQLYKSGVLSFTSCCRGRVGAFCVSKKPKLVEGKMVQRQRLVLDCRAVNLQFREPPRTELGSLASLAEVTIPEGECMYLSTSDICDCFYACVGPPGLENYFCFSHDVSVNDIHEITQGHFDVSGLNPQKICPCLRVLPMGFNWSFFLVQALHEAACISSLDLNRSSIFLDGHPSPVLAKDGCCSMPYCDNVHVLSLSPELCQSGKDAVVEKLESMGFTLHEHTSAETLTQTLGGLVDGSVGEVRATPRRMWSLIYAFEYIADAVVSTELVQRLLGHAMGVCCHNRSGMCIFRRLYDFVHSGSSPRRLNHAERLECEIFSGIIPLLVGDLRRQWSDVITASDASPSGWGLCEMDSSPVVAQLHGRWQERWRYKRLDPGEWRPRERALHRDPFSDPFSVKGTLDSVDDIANYTYNEGFPEIPLALLEPEHWKTVSMGSWKHTDEHITLKEARSLLIAVRRLSRAQRHRHKRHLILLDNMALCFALAKGRSARFDMLRVLQRVGSISLACGITLRPRWIPSELNVADGPSRGFHSPGVGAKESSASYAKGVNLTGAGGEDMSEKADVSPSSENSRQADSKISEEDYKSGGSQEGASSQGRASPSEVNPESPGSGSREGSWKACAVQEDDHLRKEVREQRGSESVRAIPAEVRGLLQGERIPLATKLRRLRPPSLRLHGYPLHGRKVTTRRGKDLRCHRVQHARGQREASPGTKMPEGMAKGHASSKQIANANDGYVWHCNGAGSLQLPGDGPEDLGGFPALPPTGGRAGSSCSKCGSASQGGRCAVQVGDSSHQRPRGSSTRQNWCVRQQPSDRSHDLGRGATFVESQESNFQGVSPVQVQHGKLSQAVQCSQHDAGAGELASLSAETRGCHRGLMLPPPGLQCCESKRPLEKRRQCQALHKDRKSPRTLESSQSSSPQVLPVVREEFSQGVQWSPSSKDAAIDVHKSDILTMKQRPDRFILEIFAGTARISSALQKVGLPSFPIDIDLFPSRNVLDPKCAHTLLNWIAGGRVTMVWLGMPCTTFSRARRNDGVGPLPLRDEHHLWGLPHLKRHDAHKLADGNKLFRFTMQVLHLCQQHRIPYILENPLTSFAWSMPPLQKFCDLYQPGICDLDFCCYGEQWRKPTRLLFNFIDISSMGIRCTGTFLRCSNTKRPHIALTGRDAAGVFLTLRAQPYPLPMTSAFASIARAHFD